MASAQNAVVRRTGILLIGLVLSFAVILWLLFGNQWERVPRYLGFAAGEQGGPLAWIFAAAVTLWYVISVRRLPPVKAHMFRLDGLKLLALVAAVGAAIVEEVVFRRLVMDFLDRAKMGPVLQVLAAGVTFGLVHLFWGLHSWKAGVNAAVSTTLVGLALGIVYLLADRSLAPCVVAHFVMTGLAEPGLIRAALEDGIGLWQPAAHSAGPELDGIRRQH